MTEILPRPKMSNLVVLIPIILSFWASARVIAEEFTHIYNDEICYISDTIPIVNITEVSSEISEETILTKDEYSSQQAKIEEEKRLQEEQAKLEAERIAEEARIAEEVRRAEEARLAAEQQAAEQTIVSNNSQSSQQATNQTTTTASQSEKLYTIDQFEFMGIVMWNNYKFSYYSEKVLPGTGLNIPGRNTTDGFVKDGDGYIVAAVNGAKGTIIPTPFGAYAKVYDFCVGCSSNQVDLYTR